MKQDKPKADVQCKYSLVECKMMYSAQPESNANMLANLFGIMQNPVISLFSWLAENSSSILKNMDFFFRTFYLVSKG